MSYAIRNDGKAWRAVSGVDDVGPDEHYSETQPDPVTEDQKVSAKRQIAEIERETLMNRAVREFMLLTAEAQAAAQGVTPAQLYAANPAYKSVKDVDTQVTALRGKLK